MNQRLKTLALFLTLPLLLVFVSACKGAEGVEAGNSDARTLRISLGTTPDHPLYDAALHFVERVEEKSDDLSFEIYHSGQITDDLGAYEMMQNGDIAVTITPTSPLTNLVPEYAIFDLLFMITDEEIADTVLDGPFGEKMQKLLEKHNLLNLAWFGQGFGQITNSVRPVESLEDLKGLKIRTKESEAQINAWRALGANPTPMSWAEVFTALQQGTIDGQENPYSIIYPEGIYEVQDYISETNHIYYPWAFLFSKPIFEKLTPEQQEAIVESVYETQEFNRQANLEAQKESFEKIKEHLEFITVSDEELERFKEAVQPINEELAKTIGEDIYNEFKEAIEQASN